MITSKNTYCDKCNLPDITITNAKTCECHLEVDATHTDPIQKLTGVALKSRQRARVAEELNKVMHDGLKRLAANEIATKNELNPAEMKYIAIATLNECKEIQS